MAETLFDIVPDLPAAALLDKMQLEQFCRDQQSLTLSRSADWLEHQGRVALSNGFEEIGVYLYELVYELQYLSTLGDFHSQAGD
tara:strand:- start:329 stop:580 length:252 start_codon:yes stop_codon:yes gene_type:complete